MNLKLPSVLVTIIFIGFATASKADIVENLNLIFCGGQYVGLYGLSIGNNDPYDQTDVVAIVVGPLFGGVSDRDWDIFTNGSNPLGPNNWGGNLQAQNGPFSSEIYYCVEVDEGMILTNQPPLAHYDLTHNGQMRICNKP